MTPTLSPSNADLVAENRLRRGTGATARTAPRHSTKEKTTAEEPFTQLFSPRRCSCSVPYSSLCSFATCETVEWVKERVPLLLNVRLSSIEHSCDCVARGGQSNCLGDHSFDHGLVGSLRQPLFATIHLLAWRHPHKRCVKVFHNVFFVCVCFCGSFCRVGFSRMGGKMVLLLRSSCGCVKHARVLVFVGDRLDMSSISAPRCVPVAVEDQLRSVCLTQLCQLCFLVVDKASRVEPIDCSKAAVALSVPNACARSSSVLPEWRGRATRVERSYTWRRLLDYQERMCMNTKNTMQNMPRKVP